MGGESSKTPAPRRATLNPDHTINWKVWKEILADPRFDWMTYDPPQKKPEYATYVRHLNFFQPRACIGKYPPCCIAQCLQWKNGPYSKIQISKPDEWLPKFLEIENENLPEFFRGVWWMKDNVANETLVTVQDMAITTLSGKQLFVKDQSCNWSSGTSLWGSILRSMLKMKVPFELEPGENPKWLGMLSGDDFIYFLGEEDQGKLVHPDGKPVEFIPGLTWLRVSCKNGDAANGVSYQYMMRKIAFKDQDGKIVKTQYFDELLERCSRPTPEGCCCNLFLCNVSDENFPATYDALDDEQLVIWGKDKYPAAAE